jgi:hypothetical protein
VLKSFAKKNLYPLNGYSEKFFMNLWGLFFFNFKNFKKILVGILRTGVSYTVIYNEIFHDSPKFQKMYKIFDP